MSFVKLNRGGLSIVTRQRLIPLFKSHRSVLVRLNSSTATGGSTNSNESAPPPPPPPKKSNTGLILTGLVAAAGAGYYYYTKSDNASIPIPKAKAMTAANATYEDYQKVYDAIAKKIEDDDDYDDGSYGPVLVRLAWHSSGTYDKAAGNGGSRAGTMRFEQESSTGANQGLINAKKFLEPIHDAFPWISYGDLYTLGGVAAVQEASGPSIKWRSGRIDELIGSMAPDGRLPDASQGSSHIRDVFYRMGFNDQEIVALVGAHCLGRCHPQNSGFDGPWTFSPTMFTNDFFKLLLDEKWHVRKWDGPKQYQDSTNSLMMLPADLALVQDKKFKEWVVKYANDNDLFFKDFASAFEKLLELGVKFKPEGQVWEFKRRNGN